MKMGAKEAICVRDSTLRPARWLFVFFCLCPFLFPLPGLATNLQPYAFLCGLLVLVRMNKNVARALDCRPYFLVVGCVFGLASLVLVFSGIEVGSLRAYFNYASIFVIPLAVYVIIECYGLSERFIKTIFLMWLAVSLVQIVVFRGFLTTFIGSPNWSSSSRGVVGLASEPSFLGITCFYFLHIASRFVKGRRLYLAVLTFMGVVLAQSAVGILFIGCFWLMYCLDRSTGLQIIAVLLCLAIVLAVGFKLLAEFGEGTRLFSLLDTIQREGLSGLYQGDESSRNRINSILRAVSSSVDNGLFPMGFGPRIGSGYGGLMCELGVLALPLAVFVSYGMSLQFDKKFVRAIYFILITALLFMNTQIGNPQLLFVVGVNYALCYKSRRRQAQGLFWPIAA